MVFATPDPKQIVLEGLVEDGLLAHLWLTKLPVTADVVPRRNGLESEFIGRDAYDGPVLVVKVKNDVVGFAADDGPSDTPASYSP